MPLIDALLQELEHEAQTTKRVLERVNDSKLNWRPHPKARTLGQLALHTASTPGAVAELAMKDRVQRPDFTDPRPASTQEVLATHEESIAKAKNILAGVSDEALMSTWRMMDGDREIFSQ